MKKIFYIIIAFYTIGVNAQIEILPLNGGAKRYGFVNNAYYKDIDNVLNQYVGTWLFTNGNNSFKIILQKKEHVYMSAGVIKFYTDFIVGEFQYIENGVEKINTLSNLATNYSYIFDYNIVGHALIPNNLFLSCNNCATNEKRLMADLTEPNTRNVSGLEAKIIFRKVIENGVEKLITNFYQESPSRGILNDGSPTTIDENTVPYGEYILIKQP